MDNIPVELAPLIARAWLDDEFKELLESNPEAAFNEYNLKHDDYALLTLPPAPHKNITDHFLAMKVIHTCTKSIQITSTRTGFSYIRFSDSLSGNNCWNEDESDCSYKYAIPNNVSKIKIYENNRYTGKEIDVSPN